MTLSVIMSQATIFGQTNESDLPSQTRALFHKAIAEQRNQDPKSAETDYKEVIYNSADFLPAHFNLALVYDAEDRSDDALIELAYVEHKMPLFPEAQFFIGIENFRLTRYKTALDALQLAVQQDPNNPLGWFWLGKTYYATSQPDKAKSALQRTLSMAPDHPGALYLMSLIEISEQDLVRSESVLASLVERYPQTLDFRQALGTVYYLEAQPDRAEKQYREILRISPSDPQALSMTGLIYLDRGEATAAIPFLKRGLAANPKVAFLQVKLGQALVDANRFDEGLPHLQRAASLDPQNPAPHFLMWKIYSEKKDRESATKELQEFKKLAASVPERLSGADLNALAGPGRGLTSVPLNPPSGSPLEMDSGNLPKQ
jgi:tetratricopeptide (TPR) repeat protein